MVSANLFLCAQADDREERGAERLSLDAAATMRDVTRDPARTPIPVIVRDLSATGMRLECERELRVGQRIQIGISGVGVLGATVVRRNEEYGCTFDAPLAPHQVRAAEAADTVVPFGTGPVRQVTLEPDLGRYPGWIRVGLLVGLSLGGWWLILALLR